jgi:hypothetical protein
MARSFNGSSDLVKATGASSYRGTRATFSASCWVLGAAQTDNIFYCEAQNNAKGFFRLGTQNGSPNNKCRVLISDHTTGSNDLDYTTTAVIMDSAWHHVGFTLDASGNWVIYVDGTPDHSASISTVDSMTPAWTALGCMARNTNAQFFAGNIGEADNWTRTLTAAEVASLAAGLPASHLAPDHYWPLWGVDSPEPDIGTGTKVAATLTGTAFASGGKVGLGLVGVGG